jgi:hypothetical protein
MLLRAKESQPEIGHDKLKWGILYAQSCTGSFSSTAVRIQLVKKELAMSWSCYINCRPHPYIVEIFMLVPKRSLSFSSHLGLATLNLLLQNFCSSSWLPKKNTSNQSLLTALRILFHSG